MTQFRHMAGDDTGSGSILSIIGNDQAIAIRIVGSEGGSQTVELDASSASNARLFAVLSLVRDIELLEQMEHGIMMPDETEFKRLGMDQQTVTSLRNRAENSEMMLRRMISKIRSGKLTDEVIAQALELATRHSSPLR